MDIANPKTGFWIWEVLWGKWFEGKLYKTLSSFFGNFLAYLMIFQLWSTLRALLNFEKSSSIPKKKAKNEEKSYLTCLSKSISQNDFGYSNPSLVGMRSFNI